MGTKYIEHGLYSGGDLENDFFQIRKINIHAHVIVTKHIRRIYTTFRIRYTVIEREKPLIT